MFSREINGLVAVCFNQHCGLITPETDEEEANQERSKHKGSSSTFLTISHGLPKLTPGITFC